MIRKFIQLLILMVILLLASEVFATTYYIDWVSGSDNNNGTSKLTPWKRAPGMQGCLITDTNDNNCRARTHSSVSGDVFILKGGATWPKEALGWDWYFGNSTTFTVDQTWYSGPSWTRPILDNEGVETTASPEGIHYMMRAYGNNQTIDNIEFKGLAQLHGTTNGYTAGMLYVGTSLPSGGEVKNCYFHGWSHGPVTNGIWASGVDAGKAAADNSFVLWTAGLNEGPDLNMKIHHNIFDGFDTTKDMLRLLGGSIGHVYNNYFAYAPNAFLSGNFLYVWGNTFKEIGTTASFDPTVHYNVIENNKGQSIIYNNLIYNTHGGNILTYSVDGKKDYIFNNVIIGDDGASLQLGTSNGGQVTLVTGEGQEMHVFNNTIQSIEGNSFYPISGPTLSEAALMQVMTMSNNHLIGPTHAILFGAGSLEVGRTERNTYGQTNAQGTTEGYIEGNYPYFAPSGGSTVNTGYDLTSFCASIPFASPSLASTACLSDTTLGVSYNSTDHTVSYPNKPAVIRSTWDIGAYEFPSGYANSKAPMRGIAGGAMITGGNAGFAAIN